MSDFGNVRPVSPASDIEKTTLIGRELDMIGRHSQSGSERSVLPGHRVSSRTCHSRHNCMS